MADMIKFYKGAVASLPTVGVNGAIYITHDEGGIYLGTGTGMKRLGDFIQVDAVANLPTDGANTSALYYCVAENVLAKWNGSEWTQINKQRTKEEAIALLGLGSLAYLSEVSEDNLNADLKAKVNAAAEGNHSHDNKELLDTYTQTEADLADAVAKKHSHTFTDEDVVDAISKEHTHTFVDSDVEDAISKKHAHTFADTDVVDAIAKKHSHTFVESELNKIVAGDVAKWNGVVADHLTSADKALIEDSIGDVNTALENYKTSNNEALAGVKATADAAATKEYADAELAKKVDKVEGKDLIATSEITRLADVHNYDDTQVKADIAKKADAETMTTELAKKVDKVEGKSLILDSEIERLAGLHNYDDTQVKADIAKKADTETMTTELGKKVDKVDGYSLVSDTEIARLAEVDNYDDEEVRGLIGDNAKAIEDLEGYVGTFTASEGVDTVVKYIDAKTANIASDERVNGIDNRVKAIEDDYLVEADIANFETKENVKKVSDDLAAYVESNNAAVADRYTKAEADGKFALIADAYDDTALANRVKAIEDDYLVEADKTALQDQITANANAITLLTNGASAEEVDGVNDLINYVKEHGTEVTGMKADIAANTKAISDHEALAAETYETKTDAGNKLTEAKTYADGLNTAMDTRVKALEDHKDDYIAAVEEAKTEAANQDAVVLSESQKYTDAAKAEAIADAAAKYETIGTAQGIVDGLKLSETYEPIGAEERAIAAAKTETENQVKALADTLFTQDAVTALIQEATQWGEF